MAAADLSRDFQAGLEALGEAAAEQKPPIDSDVRVVGEHDENYVVRLGVWPTDGLQPEYTDGEYVVFARIPKGFPTGKGKGFATVPPLEREDRPDLVNNPDWNAGLDEVVEREADVESAESYSHDWENVTMDESEDMAAFLGVAHEFLSRG